MILTFLAKSVRSNITENNLGNIFVEYFNPLAASLGGLFGPTIENAFFELNLNVSAAIKIKILPEFFNLESLC